MLILLEKFLNKHVKKIVLPLNILHTKVSIDSINEIFDYEDSINSIKITNIKDNISDLVCEIFRRIEKENIYRV